MDERKPRRPYHSPQITRVVLRREQAILSQCSTMATSNRDLGGSVNTCAYGPDNCRAWSSTGSYADSGYRPS
jgi:hypothetical protein